MLLCGLILGDGMEGLGFGGCQWYHLVRVSPVITGTVWSPSDSLPFACVFSGCVIGGGVWVWSRILVRCGPHVGWESVIPQEMRCSGVMVEYAMSHPQTAFCC